MTQEPGVRRVLLTGGGTGGHVYPALAIGSALDDGRTRFLYLGCRGRAEETVVPRTGIPIRFVRSAPYPGLRPGPAWVPFLLNLSLGTLKAVGVLLSYRPHLIVATGGYVAAPTIFAAHALRFLRLSRARILLHEQNAAPGKLNLLMGRFADTVLLTFPQTLEQFPENGAFTGYPVRGSIGAVPREEALRTLDFEVPPGRKVLFVFGGSQGARTLNRALVDALGELLPHASGLFIIHGTGMRRGSYDPAEDTRARLEARYGPEERARIASFYVTRDYFHDIQKVYAVTDLALCRAGAGSLNEVFAAGLPALVVPKANLPGDHQVMNARAAQAAGAAVILFEETAVEEGKPLEVLDGRLLARTVLGLLSEPTRLSELGSRARAFLPADPVGRIRSLAEGVHPGREDLPPASGPPPLLSNPALLARLTAERAKRGSAYQPEDAVPVQADLPCYRARAASLLTNPRWEKRNLGVKLVGLLGLKEKVPLLLAMLADRTPAPGLQRLFGGDFLQVGFIRRNILVALRQLGHLDAAVESALLRALVDPYYEVRAEAARCAAFFAPNAKRRVDFAMCLARLTADRHWEVAAEAARALGAVGAGEEAAACLLGLAEHHFWQVRDASLAGLRLLLERGAAGDPERLSEGSRRYVLTATDFKPLFAIKESYRLLREALDGRGR